MMSIAKLWWWMGLRVISREQKLKRNKKMSPNLLSFFAPSLKWSGNFPGIWSILTMRTLGVCSPYINPQILYLHQAQCWAMARFLAHDTHIWDLLPNGGIPKANIAGLFAHKSRERQPKSEEMDADRSRVKYTLRKRKVTLNHSNWAQTNNFQKICVQKTCLLFEMYHIETHISPSADLKHGLS